MKLMRCPINGLRPPAGIFLRGELRSCPTRDRDRCKQWADYVFNRDGEPGVKREWWYHLASGTWFVAERDTQKDIFIKTYLYEPGEEPK